MSRDRFQELQDPSGPGGGYYGQDGGFEMAPVGQSNVANYSGATLSDNEFFGMLDHITEQMRYVDQRIGQISQLHEQALAATSEIKHKQVSNERDRMVLGANDQMNDIKRSLQTVDDAIKRSVSDSTLPQSQRVARTTRHQALAQQFSEQVQRYRQMENSFAQRNKERLARQYKIARPDATDEEIQIAIDNDEAGQVFAQTIVHSSRIGEGRRVLRDVEERQADIKKIEKTVEELAQMFAEVSEMVNRQQEVIDSIENAVEETHVNVGHAQNEVKSAIVYRIKARKKLWIILIIVLIIIIIIVVVLVVKLKK